MAALTDAEGRPYEFHVRISEAHTDEQSRFWAGFAEWKTGAIVMTRAIPEAGNPNTPADWIIVCLAPGDVVLIDVVGAES